MRDEALDREMRLARIGRPEHRGDAARAEVRGQGTAGQQADKASGCGGLAREPGREGEG
jgi:hypothetical protein